MLNHPEISEIRSADITGRKVCRKKSEIPELRRARDPVVLGEGGETMNSGDCKNAVRV